MVKGLYTAFTGMVNEEKRLETLANNLANASTVGYKKEGATSQAFSDMLAYRIKDITVPTHVSGLGDVTLGVKIGETYTNYDQGSLQVTDKKSDIAISGSGFFAISFTNGAGQTSIKYTRDGAFSVDNEGYFRTGDGDYLLNMNGALNSANNQANYVRIDPNQDYAINSQGVITQNGVNVAVPEFAQYIEDNYPNLYLMWSTTMTIKSVDRVNELSEDRLTVPPYTMNNTDAIYDFAHPENIELLCCEACIDSCPNRAAHYADISKGQMLLPSKGFKCPHNCEMYYYYDFPVLWFDITSKVTAIRRTIPFTTYCH